MKYLIAIAVVGVISTVAVILSKRSEVKNIENIWQQLVGSLSIEQEATHAKQLTDWLARKDGYMEIIVVETNGQHTNYNDFDFDKKTLNYININFYWKNKQFTGKNWIPKSTDNILVLFRE